MKVGTDGVLLGAWTPVPNNTKRILDVGTGTGLVALMLAQRCTKAVIDAVEFDANSCRVADFNFRASPWNKRLNLLEESFQAFSRESTDKYDLIVSNPPFFSGNLRNSCARKAAARHDVALSQEELIPGVLKLLTESGHFSLILPVADYDQFCLRAARNGLYESQRLMVKPTSNKPVKRIVSVWGKNRVDRPYVDELIVELSRHNYSEEFRNIVLGFYLAF